MYVFFSLAFISEFQVNDSAVLTKYKVYDKEHI